MKRQQWPLQFLSDAADCETALLRLNFDPSQVSFQQLMQQCEPVLVSVFVDVSYEFLWMPMKGDSKTMVLDTDVDIHHVAV